jgi:hypothetical protein
MDKNSEVVGWVLLDDAAHVLVRTERAGESQATWSARQAFEHLAIQTGTFDRNRIIDLMTRQALVCEAE